MPTYTSPFTGDVIQQTDVSYYALDFSADVDLYWPLVVNPTQVPAARIMDCTPSTSGLNITLPNAEQGSVGIDILFRNFGSVSFFVNDFDGGASVEIPSGESLYFYLSDNSSTAGIWQNVTFGAGTSSADAATLAGNGLAAISGKLNVTQNVQTISTTTTAVNADRATTFVWTGGNGTFNLPAVAGLTAGWFIAFRNNGTGALNIVPAGVSQINNISSLTVNPGDSGIIMLQQSTGNFFTVGLATPSNVTFTSASYDVDSIVGPTFSLVSYAPIIQTYVSLSGTRTTDLTVTLPATTQIYILANDTGAAPYNLYFEVSGTSQPPTPLTPGSVILVLSDGNNLYVISQSATTAFYANDGSAAVPSFSFLSDTTTGMYLANTGILGLTANGVEMLNLDNSNPLDPQVSTTATFTAALISGGTF